MFNARQFEFGPFFAPGTPHEEAQVELGARRVCNGQAKLFEVVRASLQQNSGKSISKGRAPSQIEKGWKASSAPPHC